MRLAILLIYCFSNSFAWLPPERCEQNNRHRRVATAAVTKYASVESNIEKIAADQHERLNVTYIDYKFHGVPIRISNEFIDIGGPWHMYVPYNCRFHTYNPRLLSSVACHTSSCKLVHTVSTVDTYTASEGYNWGVKVSSKYSLAKVFEVGGEVSAGGTYTCAYTKGRTTTDTVECSESNGNSGSLQLYSVKSDMICDFGTTMLGYDPRDNGSGSGISSPQSFTKRELDGITSAAIPVTSDCLCDSGKMFIDTSKLSDRLLQKIMNKFPLYDPYTDIVEPDFSRLLLEVYYKKKGKSFKEYGKIIPFTNEGGDSVFQYACLLTQ